MDNDPKHIAKTTQSQSKQIDTEGGWLSEAITFEQLLWASENVELCMKIVYEFMNC